MVSRDKRRTKARSAPKQGEGVEEGPELMTMKPTEPKLTVQTLANIGGHNRSASARYRGRAVGLSASELASNGFASCPDMGNIIARRGNGGRQGRLSLTHGFDGGSYSAEDMDALLGVTRTLEHSILEEYDGQESADTISANSGVSGVDDVQVLPVIPGLSLDLNSRESGTSERRLEGSPHRRPWGQVEEKLEECSFADERDIEGRAREVPEVDPDWEQNAPACRNRGARSRSYSMYEDDEIWMSLIDGNAALIGEDSDAEEADDVLMPLLT